MLLQGLMIHDSRLFLISLGIPTIIIVTFKGFDCLKDNKMSEKVGFVWICFFRNKCMFSNIVLKDILFFYL